MENKKAQYLYIADAIQQEIQQGKWKPGEKLPPEQELQKQFQVSRMTIRHAIQTLEKRHIVHVEKNRGAFAADMELKRSKEIISMTDMVARMGMTLHSKVMRLEKGLPDEEVRCALQLEKGEEIYYLYRIRFTDSGVIAIERAHIAAKRCPGLEMFNFADYSLYDVFFEHYHLSIGWEKADIHATMIRGEDAEVILAQKSGPALVINNTVYDTKSVPIEYTVQIYNYKLFTYSVVSTDLSSRYLKD